MATLSKAGAQYEGVRARARDLGPEGPGAIRRWLVQRWRFVRDPPGVELLKSPRVLLREWAAGGYMSGDCDDAAIMGAAVALAAGFPVRFVVLGFRERGPFAHVYAEAWDGRRWSDFDITRPAHLPPGFRTRRRLGILVR